MSINKRTDDNQNTEDKDLEKGINQKSYLKNRGSE